MLRLRVGRERLQLRGGRGLLRVAGLLRRIPWLLGIARLLRVAGLRGIRLGARAW